MPHYELQFPIYFKAIANFEGTGEEALSYFKKRIDVQLVVEDGFEPLHPGEFNNDAEGVIAIKSTDTFVYLKRPHLGDGRTDLPPFGKATRIDV